MSEKPAPPQCAKISISSFFLFGQRRLLLLPAHCYRSVCTNIVPGSTLNHSYDKMHKSQRRAKSSSLSPPPFLLVPIFVFSQEAVAPASLATYRRRRFSSTPIYYFVQDYSLLHHSLVTTTYPYSTVDRSEDRLPADNYFRIYPPEDANFVGMSHIALKEVASALARPSLHPARQTLLQDARRAWEAPAAETTKALHFNTLAKDCFDRKGPQVLG